MVLARMLAVNWPYANGHGRTPRCAAWLLHFWICGCVDRMLQGGMNGRTTTVKAIQIAIVFAVLFTNATAAHAAPPPAGGCPQPPNALVISEFVTGNGDSPRWLEITNPGNYALSLEKVTVTAWQAGSAEPKLAFALGSLVAELPAGQAIAVGHIPEGKTPALQWLKLKVLELGGDFQIPMCKAVLQIDGPTGLIDAVQYDLCGAKNEPKQTAWALDPSLIDLCKNDELSSWCGEPLGPDGAASLAVGTPGTVNIPCDLDGDGYTSAQGDCDDQNKNVHPGTVELCNGVDDNCNGLTDDEVAIPTGVCLSLGVCAGPLPDGSPTAKCYGKSGWLCSYPPGYEANGETLCDGFDNDCDGLTDEGLRNVCDACGPTPTEVCNGKDDDCNGKTDDIGPLPAATCGSAGVCAQAQALCADATLTCVYPPSHQTAETACDGLDNDCNGLTDDGLDLGGNCQVGTGACAAVGLKVCGGAGEVVCQGVPGAIGVEQCGNGIDDDCNGLTDDGFHVGDQCSLGQGACQVVGKLQCSADRKGSICSAKSALPSQERCGNGIDDDCDGQTDEADCTTAAASKGCSAGPGPGGRLSWLILLLLGISVVSALCVRRWSMSASRSGH